jgi:ParB-like chromosome segregation protein Spo0J
VGICAFDQEGQDLVSANADHGRKCAQERSFTAGGRRVETMPIRSLLPGDSPRLKGENHEHIQMLAAAEGPLPAILVHRETGRVIDGMHRLHAALIKGQETIGVEFFEGSSDEAFIRAVKANTEHGLPLTLADREAAAARILKSQPLCSDRWVAAMTGLATGTVAKIRRRVSPEDRQVSARIGQDGRIRPLRSADGRRIARDALVEHPDASLKEIAKIAGISPATVRNVRERMQRGEDPVSTRHSNGKPTSEEHTDAVAQSHVRSRVRDGSRRTPISLLQSLRKDPSLRLSESGRFLLRWLAACVNGPSRWQGLIETLPPHCGYLAAELIRGCAEEWLSFAAQLEQQLRARD